MNEKCILWSKWAALGSNGFEEYIITWVSLKSSKKERIKREIKYAPILSTVQPGEGLCSVLCGSLDGREFEREWIHICVWLGPFAVHLKLS